jgi:hypothetical protein
MKSGGPSRIEDHQLAPRIVEEALTVQHHLWKDVFDATNDFWRGIRRRTAGNHKCFQEATPRAVDSLVTLLAQIKLLRAGRENPQAAHF